MNRNLQYNLSTAEKKEYVKKTIESLQKAVSTREKAIAFYKKLGALDKDGKLSKTYK